MRIDELIKTKYRNLNETEKEILKYVLTQSKTLKDMKIQEVAKATYTQPNTIVRMSKKLGFSGFSEMKHELFHHLEASLNVPSDQQDTLYHDLTQTKSLVHQDQIDTIAKIIIQRKHISIFGIGASRLSAEIFSSRLSFLGISTSTFIDQHAMFFYTNRLTSDDLCLMISYSGEQKGIVAPALIANTKGATIISLTSISDNELARMANYRLFFQSTPLNIEGADVTSRIPADLVLDYLFNSVLKHMT